MKSDTNPFSKGLLTDALECESESLPVQLGITNHVPDEDYIVLASLGFRDKAAEDETGFRGTKFSLVSKRKDYHSGEGVPEVNDESVLCISCLPSGDFRCLCDRIVTQLPQANLGALADEVPGILFHGCG